MAISIKSDSLYSGSAPTITLVGGNDTNQRLLLVCAWNNGDGSVASAITVGGDSANFVGNRVSSGGVEASISVFEMQNKAAGSYPIVLTGNGVGSIQSADVRWRVIEIDGVSSGGAFASNILNSITTQPATLNVTTTDIAAGDFVFLYHLVSEGWTAGATITNTPSLTAIQTVNVTSSGAVSAHRSGYFTAAGSNPTIANQISGFLTPGGNIDRTTAVSVRFKESAPTPDFTIAANFESGETVTVTALNYPVAPTQITIADAIANNIVLALTSVGGNDYTFTMPALPLAGTDIDYLRFGDVTATIGVVSKPSVLQVDAAKTLTTLASGFDNYVFQGWTPQPVAGDQLITVTAEGVFNSNGDYTFYAEGVYNAWYIDGTGQAFGVTIDTSGLSQVEYSSNLPLTNYTVTDKNLSITFGQGYQENLINTSWQTSTKPLTSNFGISYQQDVQLLSNTQDTKTLTLTAFGVGYTPDIPLLGVQVDSKSLQFVSFKNLPLDSKRIFYIK